MAVSDQTHTTHSITSKDGTSIRYHQFGSGEGLVLVQGTMGTAQHFMELASALADRFTVYVPDRRGRGMSGAGNGTYSIQKEVEDLDALLTHTGAHDVFGLSAGAIITLQALLTLTTIRKAVIFEPPLYVNGLPNELLERFKREMAAGKTAAAMVSAMLAAQMGPPIFNHIPHRLLEALVNMGLKSEDKKGGGTYPTMRTLASTLNQDIEIVSTMWNRVPRFKEIQTRVLLLGGSESPAYLKTALTALEKVLPNAKRIEISGVGHAAPWNRDQRGGAPETVAKELRTFFG